MVDASSIIEIDGLGMDLNVADFNGDGRTDLLVSRMNRDDVRVLFQVETGIWSAGDPVGLSGSPANTAVGDLDGDGDIDAAVVRRTGNMVSVLTNPGDGSLVQSQEFAVGVEPRKLAIGDLDLDGDLDIVVPAWGSNTMSILRNDGSGTFAGPEVVSTGVRPVCIVIADYDDDGWPDLCVVNFEFGPTGNMSIFLNQGDGIFGPRTTYGTGIGPHGGTAGDFDGDGDIDVITANFSSNGISLLLNNGDGTFAGAIGISTGIDAADVEAGDLTGDGILDVVVVNGAYSNPGLGHIDVLPGLGNGTFGPAIEFYLGIAPEAVSIGDINGDALLDFAVCHSADADVRFVLSECPIPVIATHPRSRIVDAGGVQVEFSVIAVGPDDLMYHWYRDGAPLVDGGNVIGAQTSELTIYANVDDEAEYVCRVTGNGMIVDSEPAVLAVREACRGDLDTSHVVDFADLLQLLAGWGACP